MFANLSTFVGLKDAVLNFLNCVRSRVLVSYKRCIYKKRVFSILLLGRAVEESPSCSYLLIRCFGYI